MNFARLDAMASILPSPGNLALDYASADSSVRDIPDSYIDIICSQNGDVTFIIGETSHMQSRDPLPVLCARHFLHSAIALGQADLKLLMRDLNSVICDCCESKGYLSCFCAQYSRRTGLLRYVNAGHEAPLLIRSRPDHRMRLEQGGPLLGFQSWPRYAQSAVQLKSGDRLLAFTHGVIESLARRTNTSAETELVDLVKNNRRRSAAQLARLVLYETEDIDAESFNRSVITACVEEIDSLDCRFTMQQEAGVLAGA